MMVEIETLEKTLAEHPFFQDMSERARELIAGCAGHLVVHDGERLYREGDSANEFYLLRHGCVALEVHVPGRPPLVIETLGPGEVLGWSWLVPPYRCRFTARAVGLVRAFVIDGLCLRGKCEEDHELGYEFYRHFLPLVVNRLSAARMQMIDIYGHPGAYADTDTESPPPPSPPAKPSPWE